VYWYPFVGRKRVRAALETKWGRLFKEYGDGTVVMPGVDPEATAIAVGGLGLLLVAVFWLARRAVRSA
jgi:hypothetical protein